MHVANKFYNIMSFKFKYRLIASLFFFIGLCVSLTAQSEESSESMPPGNTIEVEEDVGVPEEELNVPVPAAVNCKVSR